MPKLIAKSPLSGVWPASHGGLSLSEVALARITAVAPLAGQAKTVAKGLKALGLSFPAPNRFAEKGDARIVWTGRDQAFLINADPALNGAALTDQSDGWAGLRLEGQGADAALMRLYPIDLRAASFPPGHAARAPLNHMASVLMRVADDAFELLVFRSMAQTAWHEVETAMKHLAARGGIS